MRRTHPNGVTRPRYFDASYAIHTVPQSSFLRAEAKTRARIMASLHDLRPARATTLSTNRGQSTLRQAAVLGFLACLVIVGSATIEARRNDSSPTALGTPLHLDAL